MQTIPMSCTRCEFTVLLNKSVPAFKDGTPEKLQRVPVRPEAKEWLLGTYSEEYCVRCHKTEYSANSEQKIAEEYCDSSNFLKLGDKCPKCSEGVIFNSNQFTIKY